MFFHIHINFQDHSHCHSRTNRSSKELVLVNFSWNRNKHNFQTCHFSGDSRYPEKHICNIVVYEITSIFREIVIILGTRHIIYQQKGNFMQIKDLGVSKPESVMLTYNSLSSTGTLFLSHGKTQFLMSYWGMYISRFMGVCHSNEAKLGLKKIQEQSPGIIYQKILTSSNNFADISKITKKYCGKMRFA